MEFKCYYIVDTKAGPEEGWVVVALGHAMTRLGQPEWNADPWNRPCIWKLRSDAVRVRNRRLGNPRRFRVKPLTIKM